MTAIVVTRNYQITIPKDIREQLNIRIGDRMITRKENDKIIVEKVKDSPVDKAFGIWKNKFRKTSIEIVDRMRNKWKRNH
ncbi:AbrB/MazE/SpoVT family DNA-binding domain-containing protein [Candidatus Woesearchaeota archaeon]|nr:AbrB/MazE/SpoVT family DNA-binding domain-containing protein [Candidatus Woesearchaeota archaeon]